MARRRKQKSKFRVLTYVLIAIVALVAIGFGFELPERDETVESTPDTVSVHFVDVGQGSCTVIQSGSDAVLIDAGEREYSSKVLSFLEDNGITHLSYVIASHPHSDHIGAMSTVLDKMGADEVFMPYIIEEYDATSKTYIELLTTLDEKNIDTEFLRENKTIDFKGIKINIVTP